MLVHEADPRHEPFGFATELDDAPDSLRELVKDTGPLPWRRRNFEREVIISQVIEPAGLEMQADVGTPLLCRSTALHPTAI